MTAKSKTTPSDRHDPIEIYKGTSEKLLVSSWEKNGHTYVSVAVQRLADGEYFFTKKGFALRTAEARELAEALVAVAEAIEAAPVAEAES